MSQKELAELADLSSQHIRRKWIFSVLIASPQSSGFLRGVCMKKVFSFLISLALGAIFLIPKIITLSSQELLLLYSLLPLLAILSGYNQTRFTYREIRGQKFRWTIYGLSLAICSLCLLSYFNFLTITHITPGMPIYRKKIILILAVSIFLLLLLNLAISIRDINKRDNGLPL